MLYSGRGVVEKRESKGYTGEESKKKGSNVRSACPMAGTVLCGTGGACGADRSYKKSDVTKSTLVG